jgi:hypothetical protein
MNRRVLLRILAWSIVLAAILVVRYCVVPRQDAGADPRPGSSSTTAAADQLLAEAFAERRSGLVVEAEGVVEALLRDDLQGSRHQRFIVQLSSGQTLLVSHNIDLAPRIPLAEGDPVSFRGQYEWNERGGVIHWTHHDPQGRRPGGWIRHQGELYR